MKYAAVMTAVLLYGCLNNDGDDETAHFIYECVHLEADYACVNPDYFDYEGYGDGYEMDGVAVGSQFDMDYGCERMSTDNDYDESCYQGDVHVISAASNRVSDSGRFEVLESGLTPLVAVNGDEKAVDYMYVEAEVMTGIRFFKAGESVDDSIHDIDVSENTTSRLIGIPVGGGHFLRGTLVFECRVDGEEADSSADSVLVDCGTPGEITVSGVASGTATVTVSAGGVSEEIAVTVGPGLPDSDTGDDTDEEGDAGMGTDTETDVDTDTGEDTNDEETEVVDTDIDTALDTDVGTDTQTIPDMDGGVDAGPAEDTDTALVGDAGVPVDGGTGDAGPDAG